MRFTVLGATGFIGSHLAAHLRREGHECLTPGRDDPTAGGRPMGHVIYAIGVTADFRQRPLDTVRAHVCRLLDVLERGLFDSLVYLSSARVYGGAADGREDAAFRVNPQDPSDVYNLSKLMGEAACFATARPEVRVVRLSNVYGGDWTSENFLTDIIRAAVDAGEIRLRTSPDSSKDYVAIGDVVGLLPRIALAGQRRLYNVASGTNTSNRGLLEALARLTGCRVTVEEGAPAVSFPPLAIDRVREEFGFAPASVLDSLAGLVAEYRERKGRHDSH